MLCESCHVDIPPAWKACLLSNTCPACSGCIMSDETKELMNELKDAMSKMPNDPEGLAGWLVSNYKLSKVGNAEPTKFYGKAKRMNALKVKVNKPIVNSKDKKIQELVNLINQNSEEDENLEDEELDEDNEEEFEENYEEEESEEDDEEALMLAREAERKQRKKKANNSLVVPVEGVESGPVDVSELTEVLNRGSHISNPNMDRMVRLAKQQHLSESISSGGVGIIKRAK